jgi:hypothetical protein
MDTNETFEPIPSPVLTIGAEGQYFLKTAGRWATFLGIIGFIGCGLIAIEAFFVGSVFTRVAAVSPNPMLTAMAGFGWLFSFFYLLIALLYFFFSLYLYQFGDKIKRGITFADNAGVNEAFGKLKSFFKLWGILTIVALSFMVLCVIIGIIIAIAAASALHQ